jgi:(4S)-4-hydroxy-5-phosphonooxypentane-2,3-dione isomerase
MYAITIVLEPKPGQEQPLIDACLAAVSASRAEAGNLFFDVLVSDSRREVVFYEAYADEAAFQAHMVAPHTKAWQEVALPLVPRAPERRAGALTCCPCAGRVARRGARQGAAA